MSIKALIFDLDNTLYDENIYFLNIFATFAQNNNLDFKQIKDNFSDDFRLKSKDIFGDILKLINFYSEQKQNELFELYKSINCSLNLYDEAKKIIDFIHKQGLKTAIITNGIVKAQKNKIKLLKLSQKINHIIYAREFGAKYEKPHHKPFLKALEILKINAQEALFVGDNPLTDIKGAQDIGIRALRYINGYNAKINYPHDENITSLNQIKGYIK